MVMTRKMIILTAEELRQHVVAGDINLGDWSIEGTLMRQGDKDYKFFPKRLNYNHFRYIYRRMGIARNAVNKWVSALWDKFFDVVAKNESVKAEVEEINFRLKVKHVFKKATRFMRQYGYGLVYIGVADQDPSRPLSQTNIDKVFLKAISPLKLKDPDYNGEGEEFVLDDDIRSRRYGEVEYYNYVVGTRRDGTEEIQRIHWTRVIHLVDPDAEDQLRGISVFEPAFDTLQILKNVDWAAGESYYQNASPLYVLSYTGEPSDEDMEQIERDMREINVKSRFIKPAEYEFETVAGSGKAMDPQKWWEPLLRRVAGELEVPERILYGMPKGALSAADTDVMQWYGEVAQLQKDFCEAVLNELYERLNKIGVMKASPGDFEYSWHPLWEQDALDDAKVWQLKATAAMRLQGDPSKGIEPVMSPEEIRKFLFNLEGKAGEAVADVFFRAPHDESCSCEECRNEARAE